MFAGRYPEPAVRASHTPRSLLAPANESSWPGKLRLVLKRLSSPLNSHAAAANALSPAVDARGLGSAAKDATSVGADHTGALIF